MPEVELLGLNRLNIEGVVYHKGVKTPVDFDTAFSLKKNKRFKVTGLDTREALDYQDMQTRPRGADLHAAISAATWASAEAASASRS